jgi:hypothetical protein
MQTYCGCFLPCLLLFNAFSFSSALPFLTSQSTSPHPLPPAPSPYLSLSTVVQQKVLFGRCRFQISGRHLPILTYIRGVHQSLQANVETELHNWSYVSKFIPSKSFPIHRSSVIVTFDTTLKIPRKFCKNSRDDFIHSFIHSFIAFSVLRPVHSLFKSEFARDCDPVIPISNSYIFSLP